MTNEEFEKIINDATGSLGKDQKGGMMCLFTFDDAQARFIIGADRAHMRALLNSAMDASEEFFEAVRDSVTVELQRRVARAQATNSKIKS